MNTASLIDQLPDSSVFPDSAPRFPNIWFLVAVDLVGQIKPYSRFSGHRKAGELVWECLEKTVDVVNDYEFFHTAEGCDSVGRRRGLQQIDLGEYSHDHSLHIRFYNQPLECLRIHLNDQTYYAVAASVHYEVDRPSHLHPYVDDCPVCGCTGSYKHLYEEAFHNKSSELKNILGHDPLGVEVLLYGKAQDQKIPFLDGVNSLSSIFQLQLETIDKPSLRQDMNTGSLGIVLLDGLR